MNEESLNWQGPEYFDQPKTTDWFLAVGIIALALIVTSLIFQNMLLAGIIFVGTAIILSYSKKKAPEVEFIINKTGVLIGKNHFAKENLENFWLKEIDDDFSKLLIKNNSLANSILIIPLPKKFEENARKILKKYLEEKPVVESALEVILEKLGF